MAFVGYLLQLGGARGSIPSLVMQAGIVAKGILVLLLVMSIWSWAIIWDRARLYARVEKADRDFLGVFRRLPKNTDFRLICEQHPHSVLARVAITGHRALEQYPAEAGSSALRYDMVLRAMDRAAAEESTRLERHIGFLATTGSVSPFVGLLGTVWGVMTAFLNIGAQGSASLVVVAPGIAEALIATVAGLAAAIPAVVGYNHLLGRLRELSHATGQFATEFLDQRVGGRQE